MSFTNSFETDVLNWGLTAGSVTRPTAWYIGLFTSDPTDTGAAGTEVTGGSYARTAATFTVTGDTASNSGAVEFPAATAGWGTVSHIGVFTASSGGTMLVHAVLTTAKAIATGDVFRIPTGDLDITLD
tara:strand:- start:3500 stop:3883 length:384 start_codon:yes stop_codon:yes gene_type:complete